MNSKKTYSIKSVAIYTHNKESQAKKEAVFLKQLVQYLEKKEIKYICGDIRTVSLLDSKIKHINEEKSYDLKIGIGGDGTLLKMMRTLQKNDGLILGINFGTLGFLSELWPNKAFEGLDKIFKNDFSVDERILLKGFVYRKNSQGIREKILRVQALNEIVFGHVGTAQLTQFHVKINNRILSTYRSDGLIFSTPTGSTAYSLSTGGSILSPAIDGVILTPIAPHRLTHRPIVLRLDNAAKINFSSRSNEISMRIDGQIPFTLKPSDEVVIHKATRKARFIRLKKSHFFRTLRSKMGWGEVKKNKQ